MNQNILIAILVVGVIVFWRFIKNSKGGGVKINPTEAKKRLETYNPGAISMAASFILIQAFHVSEWHLWIGFK